MSNAIILIILFVISVVFLIVIRKKNRKSEILSFISTLIATLIGVLLAVTLSNIESDRKEKKDTIKLLHSAQNILEGTLKYSSNLESSVAEMEKDTINFNEELISSIKKNAELPYPDLFETIVSNELMSKNMSEFSHGLIFDRLLNLKKLKELNSIHVYQRFHEEILLLIALEVKFQAGKLSQKELKDEFIR